MDDGKTRFIRIDDEYNVWTCTECRYLTQLEADGPLENGIDYCPHCGREIKSAGRGTSAVARKDRDNGAGKRDKKE